MKLVFGYKVTPEQSAILSNTGWLFVDRMLRMTVGFIIGIWIARYLGAEQYGLFSYATAFVYLFNPLVTLGLDNVVIRDIVRNPTASVNLLGTAFWLKLAGGLIAFLAAVGLIGVVRPHQPLVLSLVAILAAAAILQTFETIDLWFQSQVQSKYTVLAKSSSFFVIALLKIILLLNRAPLITFAWAALAEMGLAAVALIAVYRFKGYSLAAWRWKFALAKPLFRESFPLLLAGFTIMIYMKIDQIMLGQMLNDRAVGLYTAATRISEAWYFIPTAIVSSVTPLLYRLKAESETAYYQQLHQLLRLMNAIAVAVAIPITFLAPMIIQSCYGAEYLESSSVLIVHIWAAIFVFMGVATQPHYIASGLTHLTLQRTLFGAFVNVGLNLILIPQYAGVGAAIATVISQAMSVYFSQVLHPSTRVLFWLQTRSLLFLNQRC